MTDDGLPTDLHRAVIVAAARGATQIEATHFGRLGRYQRGARMIGRLCGALSLGILSAGIAVFVVVVVMNLIFNYAPPS